MYCDKDLPKGLWPLNLTLNHEKSFNSVYFWRTSKVGVATIGDICAFTMPSKCSKGSALTTSVYRGVFPFSNSSSCAAATSFHVYSNPEEAYCGGGVNYECLQLYDIFLHVYQWFTAIRSPTHISHHAHNRCSFFHLSRTPSPK